MRIVRSVFPVFALLLVTALVSTTLVQAQIGALQINRAVYGKGGLGNDVTQRLQKMIQNNTLDIKVTNITMGGEPNKGADKTLKVDYTFRGKRLQVVVTSPCTTRLPNPTSIRVGHCRTSRRSSEPEQLTASFLLVSRRRCGERDDLLRLRPIHGKD